jgi:hypothetical protein
MNKTKEIDSTYTWKGGPERLRVSTARGPVLITLKKGRVGETLIVEKVDSDREHAITILCSKCFIIDKNGTKDGLIFGRTDERFIKLEYTSNGWKIVS